jgi:intein/homing endonuclease
MKEELNSTKSQKIGKFRLSKITEKEKKIYKGKVYDIKVSNIHSYSIDNIIVHNSAGASLIFYILGLTRVDPVEWNFPFERFINDKKSANDAERVRVTLDDGRIIDLKPKDIIKLKNGKEILVKDIKENDDLDI